MYKLIKIALIIFGSLLYVGTFALAVALYRYNPTVYAETIDVTKLPNYHGTVLLLGSSMTEYGITDGSHAELYPNKKCVIGDICSFVCLNNKCINDGEITFDKKLISIENNCYFFEGNKKSWMENGKLQDSWDSNKYGCLTSSEFRMEGVIVL